MVLARIPALLDMCYPRTCALCGKPVGASGVHVCADCSFSFHVITPPMCRICGNPVDGTIDREFVCSFCMKKRPHFDYARAACRYGDCLRDVICDFKYRNCTWLLPDLSSLLVSAVRTHMLMFSIDAVTFVPLTPLKLRVRSYNQSRLLASDVAAWLRKPLLNNVLKRKGVLGSQTRLSAAQRASHVRGVFGIRRPGCVEGRNLLLVDDVMTTGATASECARVLKQSGGASNVYVVTIARR